MTATTLPAGFDRTRHRDLALAGAGVAVLLVALVVLVTNVPEGYDSLYGLTRESVALYRQVFPYPRVPLSADTYSGLLVAVICGLFGAYLWAARPLSRRRRTGPSRAQVRLIACFTLAFHLVLTILLPPVLSSDVYRYALYGRAIAFEGINPYGAQFGSDSDPPYSSLTPWHDLKAEYGPTWLLASAALARVGGGSVLATVMAFKTFAALCSLGGAWLVYLIVQRLQPTAAPLALLLYGWNPLLLIEGPGGGHNDAFMVALALLGLYGAVRGRQVPALLALLAATLVKYLAALLLFLLLVYWVFGEARTRDRLRLTLRLSGAGAAVIGAIYFPFALSVGRLADMVPAGQTLGNATPNVVLYALAAIGSRLASLAAARPVAAADAGPVTEAALHVAFAGLAMVVAWRLARKREGYPGVLDGWWRLSLVYVAMVYGGLFPWYLVTAVSASCATVIIGARLQPVLWCNVAAFMYLLGYAALLGLASPG